MHSLGNKLVWLYQPDTAPRHPLAAVQLTTDASPDGRAKAAVVDPIERSLPATLRSLQLVD
jgi:hypothetical protein